MICRAGALCFCVGVLLLVFFWSVVVPIFALFLPFCCPAVALLLGVVVALLLSLVALCCPSCCPVVVAQLLPVVALLLPCFCLLLPCFCPSFRPLLALFWPCSLSLVALVFLRLFQLLLICWSRLSLFVVRFCGGSFYHIIALSLMSAIPVNSRGVILPLLNCFYYLRV